MAGQRPEPSGFDPNVPNIARMYDYYLGGKDHYGADRAAADEAIAADPTLLTLLRENRAFLGRAVRHLADEQGVRQFLDVGTGLPTADNTHEVAQRAAPDARIVYVDNDPIVLAHADALLAGTPEGRTVYLNADLYAPETILEAAADTLDLSQPVGLMILNTLGHVADHDQARDLVSRLMAGLPSGSTKSELSATRNFSMVTSLRRPRRRCGRVPPTRPATAPR